MTLITLTAKIIADEQTEEILFDAMRSATKVYNGLIWQLREQYEQTGKAPISRQNLNQLMKLLPRAGEYYSLSTEATRDEVIGAYRSFFTLRKEDERARPPGFRRKGRLSNLRYYDGYGFRLTEEGRLWLSLGRRRSDGGPLGGSRAAGLPARCRVQPDRECVDHLRYKTWAASPPGG